MTTYRYTDNVRKWFTISAVVLSILVITLPLGIYLWWKAKNAKLELDEEGITVAGLGFGTSRWRFDELARLGLFQVQIQGGGPFVALNGGQVAVNLLCKTKQGKQRKFMVSRFERWEEILERVQDLTGMPLEPVTTGAIGLKWPEVRA